MPDVTASDLLKPEQKLQPPVGGKIVNLDVYKEEKLRKISGHVGEALGKPVSVQSVQPVIDHPLPIHIPTGETVNTTNKNIPKVTGSYGESRTALSDLSALSEHWDFADQIVTGRSHVVGKSVHFDEIKKKKEEERLQFANQPKNEEVGAVKKFVNWLHTDKKAA